MRKSFVLVLVLLLAACGFQLRGAHPLPFASLYVPADTWETGALLKRQIRALGGTQLP